MNITGNKKVDPWIKLGLAAGGTYAIVKIFEYAIERAGGSTGQTDEINVNGCNLSNMRKNIIAKQMDAIYTYHSGPTIWNAPDLVNVILKYNECEIKFADQYFRNTYFQTLYDNIAGEWDYDGDYDAAEKRLIQFGLSN